MMNPLDGPGRPAVGEPAGGDWTVAPTKKDYF
jgi:hypothetical protein